MKHPEDLLDYVHPEQGTANTYRYSNGNTLPWTSMPFGMTSWCPQTEESARFYQPTARQIEGVRATHQPSPWIGDYGHFVVMPQTGKRYTSAGRRSSVFRGRDTTIKPHRFATTLGRYRTSLEVTPTERCACFRFTFPGDEAARILIEPFGGGSDFSMGPDGVSFEGYTRGNSGGVPDGFACYIHGEVDREIREGVRFEGDGDAGSGERDRVGISLELGNATVVTLRIATSFVSTGQARANLARETGGKEYETLEAEAANAWRAILDQVTLDGATDDQRRTFYSCLYRSHLFPRMWYEYDTDGSPVHYSPYDGTVHPGVMYADNGFWDTHRTVYSLFSLLCPERLNEIVAGWVNASKEGGWFPKWSSPGYRACMIGTHLDAVVADAVTKGVTDFDMDAAWKALLRDATEAGDAQGRYGRMGIADYEKLGWVPSDRFEHAASRTLDHAYTDFCVAQVAKALGKETEAQRFYARAANFRNTIEPETAFARARRADGTFEEPFDAFEWGGAYIEGSAWQCTWSAPHDVAGLAEAMGGRDAFIAKLDRLFELPPVFRVGNYDREIHEMTEMAAVDFGQYAHSNQPSHQVLYLYAAVGAPWKTQYWVRRTLTELYGYGPEGFAGDEDNGEMSAWYVLSALGCFPMCPGQPEYVLGSPLFERAIVRLGNGNTLTVEGKGNGDGTPYVKGVTWNGDAYEKLYIPHAAVMAGGTLLFEMTGEAEERDYAEDALPFSMSRQ